MTHPSDSPIIPVNDWDQYAVPIRPDARGGLQCLRHALGGWPEGHDCPCAAVK